MPCLLPFDKLVAKSYDFVQSCFSVFEWSTVSTHASLRVRFRDGQSWWLFTCNLHIQNCQIEQCLSQILIHSLLLVGSVDTHRADAPGVPHAAHFACLLIKHRKSKTWNGYVIQRHAKCVMLEPLPQRIDAKWRPTAWFCTAAD